MNKLILYQVSLRHYYIYLACYLCNQSVNVSTHDTAAVQTLNHILFHFVRRFFSVSNQF